MSLRKKFNLLEELSKDQAILTVLLGFDHITDDVFSEQFDRTIFQNNMTIELCNPKGVMWNNF